MKPITIAGLQLKQIEDATLAHDIWVMQQIKACGLDNLQMDLGETPEAFAQRILMQTATNGDIFQLLGGLLIPVDVKPCDWSPNLAAETGLFLSRVTSPNDKLAVRGQIAAALAGFFTHGIASSRISPKFSSPADLIPATSVPTVGPEYWESGPG